MAKEKISLKDVDPLLLFGRLDTTRRLFAQKYQANIILRGNTVILYGESDRIFELKLKILEMIKKIKTGKSINEGDIVTMQEMSLQLLTHKGPVRPRSPGQIEYLEALNGFDVVICTGPAGTGKTYLAVAKAVELLKRDVVRRIILTRPAVEAGEKLGFLPGDFKEKVDPYLRPLYDALYELMAYSQIREYMDERRIEVAPLAYMRGRNLDNAFIILDEAQNTMKIQMKMFLTRLGIGSRACITGDITQIDLPTSKDSGLLHIQSILIGVQGIKFVELAEQDIVRHPLVKEIVKAYSKENPNPNSLPLSHNPNNK